MIDWQRYIRRYVWDEQSTPYTKRVEEMSREQAHSELFFYSVLLATCFLVLTVISLAGKLPFGASPIAGVYCVTVVAAAAVLAVTKAVPSAVWVTSAPLAVIGTVAIFGFPKQMALFDQLLLLAVMVGLLRYSIRLVRIARAYPTLPSRPPEDKTAPQALLSASWKISGHWSEDLVRRRRPSHPSFPAMGLIFGAGMLALGIVDIFLLVGRMGKLLAHARLELRLRHPFPHLQRGDRIGGLG